MRIEMAKAATTTDKKPKKGRGKRTEAEPAKAKERFPKIPKVRVQMPRGKHGGMELMLIEDVMHVGRQGDVVEVRPGYGRNYLIPQGLATFVTPQARARIDKHRSNVEAMRIARVAELKVFAKKLEAVSVTIEANATAEGHLYGSVTGADIVAALSKEGFTVAEDQVQLEGALKELGLYHVKLKLAEEVEPEIKVWVVPTGGKAAEG
jgi:large subunit ribosomal protein L9